MDTLIAGASLITPAGIEPEGWLLIEGNRIAALGAGTPPRPVDVALDGGYLTAGFIDIHSHGGGGATVVGADQDAVAAFARAHLQHGTTTIMASLVSASPQSLRRDVAALAELAADGTIVGTHLEGPWISPLYKGAHDPATLRDPDPAEIDDLLRIGGGSVRMVTLAPELDNGIDAVRRFAAAGAIAAIGHTDADFERTCQAVDAGATCATHLFNAMRPVHHREPGPIAALTGDERVTCELICDGVHLHAGAAAFASRAAQGRVVLVTDAMSAAAGQDGDYLLGDLAVKVESGVARLVEGGAIAGSTLTMDAAVAFAVRRAGMSLLDAVAAATSTPARMLGLTDRGSLLAGSRADLCHLDADLGLTTVWAGGRRITA